MEMNNRFSMESTELVIICFKRPERLLRILEKASDLWSGPILICHDGVDSAHLDEKWLKTREICLNHLSTVKYRLLLQNSNLGSGKNIPSAVSYSLNQFQACIVIEDDLDFCDQFFEVMLRALNEFEDYESVMHIAARREINMQSDLAWNLVDYVPVWGWATWRKSWKYYEEIHLNLPNEIVDNFVASRKTHLQRFFWRNKLKNDFTEKGVDWDLNWMLNLNAIKGKVALSPVNLIRYLGNDPAATNTKGMLRESLIKREFDEFFIKDLDFCKFRKLSAKQEKQLGKRMYAIMPVRYLGPLLKAFGIHSTLRRLFLVFFRKYT